jgi:hypothetical protein
MKYRKLSTQERLDMKEKELENAKGKVLRGILKANIKVLKVNLKLEAKGDK